MGVCVCLFVGVCVCLCVQDSQKLAEKVKEEKRSSEREQRKGETQLQKEGKKPFFLKKCEPDRVSIGPTQLHAVCILHQHRIGYRDSVFGLCIYY